MILACVALFIIIITIPVVGVLVGRRIKGNYGVLGLGIGIFVSILLLMLFNLLGLVTIVPKQYMDTFYNLEKMADDMHAREEVVMIAPDKTEYSVLEYHRIFWAEEWVLYRYVREYPEYKVIDRNVVLVKSIGQ